MLFCCIDYCSGIPILTFGELKPVIEFGKMMAFGITIAFILTFTFLPCLLYLIKNISVKIIFRYKDHKLSLKFFKKISKINLFNILLTFVLLCFGISKLEVENRFIDYFEKDTEIYKGMYEIDSKLGEQQP
ncbi:MAG: hypothetical protein Ct9H90mP22_5490 [Gammaproteobacteria bacterium]|nr:MAG: hypothetical protein Ct9H90mP22_5490 [Gammaproteobacteria bacterium]